MGFIIIGIGSLSGTRLNRPILQIISHGFINNVLFFLVGIGYDRLNEMGRMAIPMPKILTIFSIFSMASLALSSMSGFFAEFTIDLE
ncbi:putative NADH:ubiquinone reductase (H(+)-translocating) [Lupinus albus]|uniref:Putative NADH:ubiquinone reductase (H(+)-translocating) n=1 Tax=Lupinus albus TaxID=3870 RepID=A0A6A4NK27_LUPAL|nr:putative NADH:ubiquinone reductase (H(+)-translocating) [Lupinus albus]